ncbi:hypothetical protein [Thalassospira marina]|uniref:Uncharacterized protein n=1 Tax=Thalassospira marina TaxID=2048283 RepID=A0A2N3KS05_9PROT|nr:hypothetical protein [Thalassospira marina]AUG52535.1 hypothetical protein CSC3H3_07250 [Thalassospira marina]PKR53348.1 hypothetical protein COO20_14730 [Thalassospira marina]
MSQIGQRLSDKIILAHRQAVEEGKAEVAEMLIQALEIDASYVGGPKPEQRENLEDVEAAFTLQAEFRAKHGRGV